MAIKKDTLDQLLAGRDPKEVFHKDGLFDELKKALAAACVRALPARTARNGLTSRSRYNGPARRMSSP
jgi:hypothetical protein